MSAFTDVFIKTRKPRTRRYEVREPSGLGLWVYPSGRRSWVHTYTFEGEKYRHILGEYPAMRLKKARSVLAEDRKLLQQGVNPRAADLAKKTEARLAPTVSKLIDEYIEKWAKRPDARGRPRKKSWAEDERMLEQNAEKAWGKRKAKDITKRDVRLLLDSIVDRGAPIQANRVLAVVRRMFNWAVEQDILEHSPCLGIKAPAKERKKDRVLSEEEIRALWAKLEMPITHQEGAQVEESAEEEKDKQMDMGGDVRRALKLILVTAQRPGEVARLSWEEIDGDWWNLPAERAKNEQSHRIPLSELAQEILGDTGKGPVFPSPRKSRGGITGHALAHALRRNRELLGIEHFTPHDLRRTAASKMTQMGVSRLVVQRILNHVETGVTAVYDRHSYDHEKREALEAWGRKLRTIIEGTQPKNVVEITTAR